MTYGSPGYILFVVCFVLVVAVGAGALVGSVTHSVASPHGRFVGIAVAITVVLGALALG